MKLCLSANFLRNLMCTKKNVLKLALLKLTIIIVIIKVKMYMRNKRFNRKIAKLIQLCEEIKRVKAWLAAVTISSKERY